MCSITTHLQTCSIPQSEANKSLCNQAHLFLKRLFRPLISVDPFTNLTVLLKTVSLHLVESQISYLGSASCYFFGPDTGFTINYRVCSLSIAKVSFQKDNGSQNSTCASIPLEVLLQFRLLGYTPRISESRSLGWDQ